MKMLKNSPIKAHLYTYTHINVEQSEMKLDFCVLSLMFFCVYLSKIIGG